MRDGGFGGVGLGRDEPKTEAPEALEPEGEGLDELSFFNMRSLLFATKSTGHWPLNKARAKEPPPAPASISSTGKSAFASGSGVFSFFGGQ